MFFPLPHLAPVWGSLALTGMFITLAQGVLLER